METGRGGIPTRTYLLLDVKRLSVERHGSYAHIQALKAKDKQVWQDILQVGGRLGAKGGCCKGWVLRVVGC